MGLDRLADWLLEATPDFEASGGNVRSPEGPLKGMPQAQVVENIVIFYAPEGNFMKAKGWAMAYFMDSPRAAQLMKQGEIDYPMFMPGSLNMRFGGYSMIDAIWKKRKAPRVEKPEEKPRREAMKHVVGALEAYVEDGNIFVDNLSVRPGWKRNTIGSKLMQAIKDNWPGKPVTHSKATDQGTAFLKKTGQLNPDPRVESTAHSILTALLEDKEKPDDWIGVDLDGTLAKYTEWKGPTKIGEPIPAMVKRLRRWVGHGKKVKIFTARADDEKSVNAIKRWLRDNELPDLEVTNLKDQHMTELWDDRAIAVVKNTGEVKENLDPQSIQWGRHLIAHINDGGIWGIPATGQIYQFDHGAKTLTLVQGPVEDNLGWTKRLKELFGYLGYRMIIPHRGEEDEMTVTEAVVEALLNEAPEFKTLKAHQVKLSEEERGQAGESPIKKSVVKGETWYWSNTHRCYQAHSTVEAAVRAYRDIVEPSG